MTPRVLTGGCLCGAVRYSSEGRPLATIVCHCEHCQRSTGSAFSIVVAVRRKTLHVDGELAAVETVATDTGEDRQRQFCPRCGSPILSLAAELPGLALLKAGTLDDRSWLSPTVEGWRESAQPWTQRSRPRLHLRRGLSSTGTRVFRLIGR